jgi:hypothetical protein
MTWEDEIRKQRPSYSSSKSKFWGDTYRVPNELGRIAEKISKMGEEERNNPEVQKDIKYIKELVAEQKKLLQKYLEMVE